MKRIEIFKLLDPQKAINRIEKNKLKFFLGGYSGYLTCTVKWKLDHTEEGPCGLSTKAACCDAAAAKYPQTDDWWGTMEECDCE